MNTLKLSIKELEIDEFQNELSEKEHDRYFDYNEIFRTKIILPPNSQYRDVTFSEVTSPVALVIISDQLINIKVNDFEITNTQIALLNTNISSLEVANVDLLNANVTINMWGVQK